jgi:DNA-binding NarL/FixJ family response regulator
MAGAGIRADTHHSEMTSSLPEHPPAPPDAPAREPVRVLIVDVHPVVRSGVAAVLAGADGFEMAGEAGAWQDAVELAHAREPDIVLLDLSVATAADTSSSPVGLLRAQPRAPSVVVFAALADQRELRAARAAGAAGCVLKDATPAELVAALRQARKDDPPTREPLAGDDVGETELVRLAATGDPDASGLPNKRIARRLGISEKTVKSHLTSVFQRIGVTDRTQAALWAQRNGLS